jgi:hypothetical protein
MYDEHIQMINDWFKQHDDYGAESDPEQTPAV